MAQLANGHSVRGPPELQLVAFLGPRQPRFFDTIGARIMEGLGFDERDTPESTHVALVNQAFAQRHFRTRILLGGDLAFAETDGMHPIKSLGWWKTSVCETCGIPPIILCAAASSLAAGMVGPRHGAFESHQRFELHVADAASSLPAALPRLFAQIDPNLTLVRLDAFDKLGEEGEWRTQT